MVKCSLDVSLVLPPTDEPCLNGLKSKRPTFVYSPILILIKKILIGFGEQSFSIHIVIIYCNKTKKETLHNRTQDSINTTKLILVKYIFIVGFHPGSCPFMRSFSHFLLLFTLMYYNKSTD